MTPRLPYRRDVSGGRIEARLSADDRDRLSGYAVARNLTLAQANRELIHLALENPKTDPSPDAEDRGELVLELGLLNLIAIEQVLKLVETIIPNGAGAADAFLVPAAQAAQERLARGTQRSRRGAPNG